MLIIADIAGRYNELMLLIEKAKADPKDIVLLGDLNDRGPDTNKVIQWAIDNKVKCVKSNHGDMFIRAYEDYKAGKILSEDTHLFLMNGGHQTLDSYGGFQFVPQEHIDYLKACLWYIETNDLILTHAPLQGPVNELPPNLDEDFFWVRRQPTRLDKFQIHGHNTFFEEYKDKDGIYGMCLDNCGENELRAIEWPSRTIYTQEYL